MGGSGRLTITDLMDGPNHLERISNGCSHMQIWMPSPHAVTTKLKALKLVVLPPFQNIRCFRFMKQIYLDML
jgi:hypothetical protein